MNSSNTKNPSKSKHEFRENAMLKTNDILIDERYQRKVNEPQINQIAANMDKRLFGRLEVDIRDDGNYYVVDGQHRLLAAIRCGMTEVPCGVALSEGVEAEATEFVNLNRSRKRVTGFDLFTARIMGADPDALAVARIMDKNGYPISNKLSKDTAMAVVSLEKVYKNWGPDSLVYAVQTFREAYETSERLQGFIIVAIGHFHGKASKYPKFVPDRLPKLLKSVPISEIKRKTSIRTGGGGVSTDGAAYVLMDIYNNKLGASNRFTIDEIN